MRPLFASTESAMDVSAQRNPEFDNLFDGTLYSLPLLSSTGADGPCRRLRCALTRTDLAFLEVVGHLVDALVGDLRDVQQPVTTRQHLHDGAEVENLQHGAFVGLADGRPQRSDLR
jgi:hypothetical protein